MNLSIPRNKFGLPPITPCWETGDCTSGGWFDYWDWWGSGSMHTPVFTPYEPQNSIPHNPVGGGSASGQQVQNVSGCITKDCMAIATGSLSGLSFFDKLGLLIRSNPLLSIGIATGAIYLIARKR